MLSRIKKYLLLVVCISIATLLHAQQNNFPFTAPAHYNSVNGINGSAVMWTLQDHNGFMWLITEHTLNRFDGYSFRSYNYVSSDMNSHTAINFITMAEDKKGVFWIASNNAGLFSFNPMTEKFIQFPFNPHNANSICSNVCNAVSCDGQGHVWIGTDIGLDEYNPETKIFKHFKHNQNDSTSISDDNNVALCYESNHLWLINSKPGLDYFNTQTGMLEKHFDYPFALSSHTWPEASFCLSQQPKETIWIGSDRNIIYGFHKKSKQWISILNHDNKKVSGKFFPFYPVFEDHAGNLWTMNDENEFVFYNSSQQKFYYYPLDWKEADLFEVASLIFEDINHKIWIGTQNGAFVFDTERKNIFSFQHDKNNPNSIDGNIVYGINRDAKDRLLIASSSVQIFDKQTNTFSKLNLKQNGADLDMNGCWQIYIDKKGLTWFAVNGGRNGKLISYNPVNESLRSYKLESSINSETYFGYNGIIEDSKERYWVSTWATGGIFCLNQTTSEYKNYNTENSGISTNRLGGFIKDSHGIIHIGNLDGGFITLNPDNETFKIYHHRAGDANSINCESAYYFIESKNHLIWFCTDGGGIGVFNPKTEKFKSFNDKAGILNNKIESLVEDKKGNYWIGTSGGIFCFAPPENPFDKNCKINFRNYNVSDGLPSDMMNTFSSFCDSDGTLFFGTKTAGMFYFNPDDLKDNTFIPPVYITNFSLMNNEVNLKDSNSVLKFPVEFTKEINLTYQQNILSFTFAALNFIHPEKNKYAYMMQGFDNDWIYTDASKRFATYTNLDPGNYVFKVKGSNNDGLWNPRATEIKIFIAPPFWQTVWFRILVGATLAVALYLFYRYRIGQILLLQKIRNKIAADLHDDIGSTLNSISIYSEVAKKDSARKDFALEMIGLSSRKIIDSLSDIVWSINPENDQFDKIILRMRSLTYNMLKAKKIDCTFRADETLNEIKLPMDIRRNFYLIFKEALNNLVKYSNAKRASILISYENKNVTFTLRDDGVGFNNSITYNGNGLNNMKRRAIEIKAQLKIETSVGIGTSVSLSLRC